jgi:hypothetical protein
MSSKVNNRFLLVLIVVFQVFFSGFSEKPVATTLPSPRSYLFILFDAGETNALTPVIEKLREDTSCDISVLVMGTARELVKTRSFYSLCQDVNDLVQEKIDRNWPREKELLPEQIESILSKISLNQPTVVAGVASAIQGQLLDAFTPTAEKTIAVWDNFNASGAGSAMSQAHETQKKAQYLFVPSEYVANAAEFKDRDPNTIKIVGSPSLQRFVADVANQKSSSTSKASITIVGGYGEEYEKSFKLMIDCLIKTNLWKPGSLFHRKLIIQLHPKSDGSYEKFIVNTKYEQRKMNHSDCSNLHNWEILHSQKAQNTPKAVSKSHIILCYSSTVGFQALACKKHVIFVVPKDDPYTNLAIDLKLAKKVATHEELKQEIIKPTPNLERDIYKVLGIPKNSCHLFLDNL